MCTFEHPDQSCLGDFDHNGWTLLMSRKLTDEEWSELRLDQTYNYLTENYDPYIAQLVIGRKFPDVEFELQWAA